MSKKIKAPYFGITDRQFVYIIICIILVISIMSVGIFRQKMNLKKDLKREIDYENENDIIFVNISIRLCGTGTTVITQGDKSTVAISAGVNTTVSEGNRWMEECCAFYSEKTEKWYLKECSQCIIPCEIIEPSGA